MQIRTERGMESLYGSSFKLGADTSVAVGPVGAGAAGRGVTADLVSFSRAQGAFAGLADHLTWWQRPLQPLFKDSLTLKPLISKEKCIACGACHEACPMKAISMVKSRKKTQIDDEKCIRCYCCHEMYADDAVILRGSLLYRFAQR